MPVCRCAPSSPGPRAVHRPARGEGHAADSGVAAVEFAIVLPLLLLLLFGIVDFGRAIQQQILITEAAREAARVGSVGGTVVQMQAQITTSVGSGFQTGNAAPTVSACGPTPTLTTNSSVTITHKFVPLTPVYGLMQIFGVNASAPTLSATGVMSCVG